MFIFTRLKLWALALAGVLGSIFVAFFVGSQKAKKREAERNKNEYINTRENIDKALGFDDADDAREWLRNRGE